MLEYNGFPLLKVVLKLFLFSYFDKIRCNSLNENTLKLKLLPIFFFVLSVCFVNKKMQKDKKRNAAFLQKKNYYPRYKNRFTFVTLWK